MIDLNPNHLATVERILTEHVPECEVRAFGSRAMWTSKDYSDLDLAVVGKGPLDWRTLGHLRESFEDSDLPIRVDVLDWHSISESFRKVIERDYVVVQEEAKPTPSNGWREVTLGDFAPLTYGKGLRTGDRNPSGDVPVIGSNGIIGYHDTPLTKGPTIVIGRKGTVGAVRYSPVPCWPIDTTFFITGGDSDLLKFRYYAIKSLPLQEMNADSAVPGLNRNDAHACLVRVPDDAEQRTIAHVLGTLDDKIELNRRMNETLEAMARALFKSWFVDFEPVRAKMNGRWRRGESIPGLPSEHYDLFPDRLVDSELGEIPEGWVVKTLGEMVELNPREPMKRGALAPYLDMAALPTSGSSPANVELREYKSGTRFRNGDTLLARITPCLENGKTAFVQSLATGTVGWGSTEFIVLRAVPPVPPEYTYLLARDAAFREHAIQSMTGTSGRQRVQVDALAPYLLPYPPAEIWAELRALLSPVFAQFEFNRQEALTLSAQRDALLPGLVSGQVEVAGVCQVGIPT